MGSLNSVLIPSSSRTKLHRLTVLDRFVAYANELKTNGEVLEKLLSEEGK